MDRIAFIKLELGFDAHPACNLLQITLDRSRDPPASCHSVGTRRRKPPVIRIKCHTAHRPAVHQCWPDWQGGLGIPEPDSSVPATRRDHRAGAVKGHTIDWPSMRKRLSNRSKCLGIPEPCGSILARRHNRTAVRAIHDAAGVTSKGHLRHGRPALRFPESRATVMAAGGELLSIRAEGQTAHGRWVP